MRLRRFSCVVLALTLVACHSATQEVGVAPAASVRDTELTGQFNNLSRSGTTYFAGFPTADGLRAIKASGVTRVISLKTNEEVKAARGFDEAALAKELGLELIVIPVTAKSFSAADVDRFSAAYEGASGPILIHCGSSNTVGGVWAAYLARVKGMSKDAAIEQGRAAGLRSPDMQRAAEEVIAAPAR
jgi:uncharacterized protein (TIGR01244 family)